MTEQEHEVDATEQPYVTKSGMVIDPKRFGKADRYLFAPFDVRSTTSIKTALARDELADDDPIIVAEINGGNQIAFATAQLAFHHVAQGLSNGEPWMVSF